MKGHEVGKNYIICFLLQTDILRVREYCSANLMKPNFSKIRVISFFQEKTVLNYRYRLSNTFTFRTDCVKDLGVHTDSNLHFHQHVDSLFSHTMKLLGLIPTITFSSSSLDSLLMLYIAIVRSKLEYASVVWNSITNTDSNKLEGLKKKSSPLSQWMFSRICQHTG
jgi:hypothetical protein